MTRKKTFTYEQCLEIASKYTKRKDFKEKDRCCFNFSKKMGWYDSITKHINTKSPKHRTYEEVLKSAKKYQTRMEFKKNDMANYCFAVTHGWLDDVCSHMRTVGDLYKRCIYVYELPNKVCYIGLTYDIKQRHTQHCGGKIFSTIRNYCIVNNIKIPEPKQLTEYLDSETASRMEGEFLEKYKNNGWKCLNIAKTGGLGGNKHLYKGINIDIGLCKKIAMGCETPTEFQIKHRSLYRIAKQREWIEYIFSHFDKETINAKKRKRLIEYNKKRTPNIEKMKKIAAQSGLSKGVLQYDLNGNFIKEYISQTEAAKALGHPNSHSDIGRCCLKKLKTCLGYVWKYKENNVLK